MGQQERSGWYALASRVLGNIPSADEGPVAEALAALKEEVPAVQDIGQTNFGTPGGPVFGADLYKACEAAGFEVILRGFTQAIRALRRHSGPRANPWRTARRRAICSSVIGGAAATILAM